MLPFDEARARLLALAGAATTRDPDAPFRAPKGDEEVSLDAADGRVLAEDVAPPFDLPAFDASTMDGYAVARNDLAEDGGRLALVGESRAGHAPPPLAKGTTMRIFTGAIVPVGADAVVMQERVEVRESGGQREIVFAARPASAANVRFRGSDLRRGEPALAGGTRLGPAALGLAASCDRATVRVARRPRVVVITNGDELRTAGSPGTEGSIPESNGIAIATMARRAGAEIVARRTVPDVRDEVARALDEGLRHADLVITIGGVSVGDHDVVRDALSDAGVSLDFFRVAIKPGKPLAVGKKGDTIVLGLPGNPASAMVTFALFGVPLVRALEGDREPLPRTVPAVLSEPLPHEPGRMELVRAVVRAEGSALVARAVKHQASGAGIGVARANALVVVPREAGPLPAGAPVQAYLYEDLCL